MDSNARPISLTQLDFVRAKAVEMPNAALAESIEYWTVKALDRTQSGLFRHNARELAAAYNSELFQRNLAARLSA